MQQKLEHIVQGVLLELQKRNLAPMTLSTYERYYRLVKEFFESQDTQMYSDTVLDLCFEHYQERFQKKSIGHGHLTKMKQCLHFLRDYAHHSCLIYKGEKGKKKYIPTAISYCLIEQIITEADLKSKQLETHFHGALRKFFCYLEQKNINSDQITDEIIRTYLFDIHKEHKNSMWYIIASVREVSAYLNRHGISELKMDFSYYYPKTPPVKLIPAFTMDEVQKMVSSIDTATAIGKRNLAILLLACYTGLRGIDIIQLELGDIKWKEAKITLIQSKTEALLELPVNGQILNALADYILHARPESDDSHVFLTSCPPIKFLASTAALNSILHRVCKKAGVEKRNWQSFHSLRRACATNLFQEGIPITTISQILGHKDINQDRHYLTYDLKKMSLCSMGFEGIPLMGGVYQ